VVAAAGEDQVTTRWRSATPLRTRRHSALSLRWRRPSCPTVTGPGRADPYPWGDVVTIWVPAKRRRWPSVDGVNHHALNTRRAAEPKASGPFLAIWGGPRWLNV